MTRADQIKGEMATLENELADLAQHEGMTARELARATKVSPTTAARFKAGEVADMKISTLTKLMAYTKACPLCRAATDPKDWGADSGGLFASVRGNSTEAEGT